MKKLCFIILTVFIACKSPKTAIERTNNIQESSNVLSGYDQFGFDGGYEIGSFVSIIDNKISSPILTREGMLDKTGQPGYLNLGEPIKIPASTFDWTSKFQNYFNFSGVFSSLSPELRNNLQNIQTVSMTMKEGDKIQFRKGSIALTDFIFNLDKTNLEKIDFELDLQPDNVFFITEVVQFKDAKLEFKWNDSLTNQAKIGIKKVISIGDSIYWNDNGKLIVNYENINVAYKKRKISEPIRKRIKDRITSLSNGNETAIDNNVVVKLENWQSGRISDKSWRFRDVSISVLKTGELRLTGRQTNNRYEAWEGVLNIRLLDSDGRTIYDEITNTFSIDAKAPFSSNEKSKLIDFVANISRLDVGRIKHIQLEARLAQ